ncbi:MAG: MFS transporter, partial [Oligoflexales bacterium]|nr:MFS transporter [Oligoflexales bacterium]
MRGDFIFFRVPSISICSLFLARFIISTGNFVIPLLTLFLTQKLHYSPKTAGVVLTIVTFGMVIGSICGGILADSIGRKKSIMLTSILSSVSFLLVPYVKDHSPNLFLSLVFLGVFGIAAIDPSINALVADCSEEKDHNESFSLIYMAANLGCCAAPLIASFLFLKNTDLVFILDALATLLSAITVALFVTEPVSSGKGSHTKAVSYGHKESTGGVLDLLRRNPLPLMVIAIFTLWPLIYSNFYFAFPLYCNEIFKGEGVKYYGYLAAINGAAVFVFTPFVSSFAKKFHPITNVIFGGILYTIGFGSYFFVRDFPLVITFLLVFSIGEIFSNT